MKTSILLLALLPTFALLVGCGTEPDAEVPSPAIAGYWDGRTTFTPDTMIDLTVPGVWAIYARLPEDFKRRGHDVDGPGGPTVDDGDCYTVQLREIEHLGGDTYRVTIPDEATFEFQLKRTDAGLEQSLVRPADGALLTRAYPAHDDPAHVLERRCSG